MAVHVKYAETNTGLRQVSAYSVLNSRQAVVGQGVGARYDGKDIDAGGEPAYRSDFGRGQRRSA